MEWSQRRCPKRRAARVWTLALLATGCGNPTGAEACPEVPRGSSAGICLDLSHAGALAEHAPLMESEVAAAVDAIRPVLPVTDLRIVVYPDLTGVIPEIGMGGYNPSPDEVRLFADPGHPEIETVLRTQLGPILVHEIHHAMRRRAVGYGSTLLEAAVTEGLADHFALEVFPGDPPPWSVALDAEALGVWTPEVLSRDSGAYDHGAWFLGSSPSIPRWTGYAVGFALVDAALERSPGSSAAGLVGEPASSLVPPAGQGEGHGP